MVMSDLTISRKNSGGNEIGSATAVGIGVGVGMAAFHAGRGSVAVGLASTVSPFSVAAIHCAGGYAGYLLMQK